MRIAPLGLLAMIGALACGQEPSVAPKGFELRVDEITIRAVDGVIFDEAALRAAIREAVLHSQSFVDPGLRPAPVLATQLRLGEVAGADGGRVLRLELAAQPPSEQHALLGRVLDATIELERRDGTLVAHQDVPIAITRGVSVMDAKLQLLQGAEAEAHKLLDASDPEIVVLALEQVGRQRWRALADDVAGLLAHDDERVVAAAVECLGVVGGPQHTAALLRHVRLADTDQARRLYETLALLGGDEALGFLEFAARNEDDPAMADVAAHALGRLSGELPAGPADTPDAALRGHRP